ADDAARDAPVVEAAVFERIRGAAGAPGGRASGVALRDGRRLLRHPPVRRIEDQPRAAVLRIVVFVPVHGTRARVRAADRGGAGGGALLAFADDVGELGVVDFLERLAGKLLRLLHRNAVLVFVRVGTLQIGIAPRGSWCGVFRRLLRGNPFDFAQDKRDRRG